MASMTQQASSDCSYPESDNEDMKSQISKVYERLAAVMKEETQLHRDLEELLAQQEAELLADLKRAEENVESFKREREEMRLQLTEHGLRLTNHVTTQIETGSTANGSVTGTPASGVKPFHPSDLDTMNQFSLDLPATAPAKESTKPKSRYGGNQVVAKLGKEKREYEDRLEGYRAEVEEAEEATRQWETIRSTCTAQGDEMCRQYAENEIRQASANANRFKAWIPSLEKEIAWRGALLMQFPEKQEDKEDPLRTLLG